MNAAERIRARREELGLSQEELAFKLGYKNRSSVNKVENSRDLSLKKVRQYAEALECTPAFLLGWDSEEAVEVPEFSEDAMEVMEQYAKLSEPNKVVVKNLINSLLVAEGK